MDKTERLTFHEKTAVQGERILTLLDQKKIFTESIESIDKSIFKKTLKAAKKIPAAFTGKDTAFFAGCFPQSSLSYVLPVNGSTIELGKRYRISTMRERESTTVSYLQIVLIKLADIYSGMDRLLAKRSLTGILPGYLAKSFGVNTSVKIHRELWSKNFDSEILENMIASVFSPFAEGPNSLSIITGFDCDAVIDELGDSITTVNEELNRIKRSIIDKNLEECETGLNCNSCDESVICDNVREFTKEMEKNKK